MNETNSVISSIQNHVLHIQLNQPKKLNALDQATLAELAALFSQAETDTSVKAVLISGSGKAFCAGADIKQLATLNARAGIAFASKGQETFNLLSRLSKPSVAAVHGYVLGGGCELAMSATFRIAAENTFFSQPEIMLGVIPGFGGTQRLARLIGKTKALELCLTGERINAATALSLGLVSAVCADDQLIQTSFAFLEKMTVYSATAIQGILSSIQCGTEMDLTNGLALEAAHFGACCGTADKREGTTAFLEKRKAVFSGE